MPHLYQVQSKLECFLEASIVTWLWRSLPQDEEDFVRWQESLYHLTQDSHSWMLAKQAGALRGCLWEMLFFTIRSLWASVNAWFTKRLCQQCLEADPHRAALTCNNPFGDMPVSPSIVFLGLLEEDDPYQCCCPRYFSLKYFWWHLLGKLLFMLHCSSARCFCLPAVMDAER